MKIIRPQRVFVLLIVMLLTGILLIPNEAARAQSDTPVNVTITVGFEGVCKEELWFPVRMQFENQGPTFDGTAAVVVPDFPNEWSYTRPLSLAEGARKELTIMTFARAFDREIVIRLQEDGATHFEQIVPINCVQEGIPVIGIWAATPSAFNVLGDISVTGVRGTPVQIGLEDFPTNSQGLEALDIIVISDVDTGELPVDQRLALETWVANGGKLIVTGGTGWQKTAAGLSSVLPLEPSGSITIDSLFALAYLGNDAESVVGSAVMATGTLAPGAESLIREGEDTMVARKQIGLGESIYFAVDPSQQPLRGWPGMSSVYGTLLKRATGSPTWAGGFSFWFEASNGLFNIPGLGLPSATLICGFLFLYVMIIGPINFFILSRLKKREWAWLTIPILVVGFSGMAFLIGLNIRGSRPVIHELSIVQVWPGQTQARVDTLVGVFSPRRDTYRLEVGPGMIGHPIPSGTIGDGGLMFQETVDGVTVPELRVDVGGIQAIATTGQMAAPNFDTALSLIVEDNVALLQGQATNRSGEALFNAIFLGPGGLHQEIGTFADGDTYTIDTNLLASTANPSLITPSGFQSGGDNTASELFGPDFISGFDDPEMARRISLFQAAFGNSGTRADGYYILGWMMESPIEATLAGSSFQREALTLYVIQINPQIDYGAGTAIVVRPRLFNWALIEDDQSGRAFSPYNASLFNSDYSLRFTPTQLVQFETVESLTLHLGSYGESGSTNLDISLWNFETEDWELQEGLIWGDHAVANPAQYVGFGGEVRLRITTLPNQSTVQLENADFTLIVNP